jgi:hypothetical protein
MMAERSDFLLRRRERGSLGSALTRARYDPEEQRRRLLTLSNRTTTRMFSSESCSSNRRLEPPELQIALIAQ